MDTAPTVNKQYHPNKKRDVFITSIDLPITSGLKRRMSQLGGYYSAYEKAFVFMIDPTDRICAADLTRLPEKRISIRRGFVDQTRYVDIVKNMYRLFILDHQPEYVCVECKGKNLELFRSRIDKLIRSEKMTSLGGGSYYIADPSGPKYQFSTGDAKPMIRTTIKKGEEIRLFGHATD